MHIRYKNSKQPSNSMMDIIINESHLTESLTDKWTIESLKNAKNRMPTRIA